MGVKTRGTPRACQELPGLARVNKVTSASLGYPISVFNKKIYSQRTNISFQGNKQTWQNKQRATIVLRATRVGS